MDTINILVVNKISDECLKQIASVNPRIKILPAFQIWEAPDSTHTENIDCNDEEFNKMLAQAEIIFGFRTPKNVVARAPRLKWVQTFIAGIDHFLDKDIVDSDIIITNTSGLHNISITELAFEKMLMLVKMAPLYFRYQQEKKWVRHQPGTAVPIALGRLHGKILGIIGLGNVGRRIAYVGKAFGMRVIATRRSARKISRARNVDVVYPREKLGQLMAESDFITMVLPSTPETKHIVGEKELRMMKPTAFLINVGRGDTVDEEALVRALEEKWIAGAGLDAFAVEPLPKESKLWELSNVILTPHLAGPMENFLQRVTNLFCENLKRYIEGERLVNVTDKKHGY